MDEVPEKYCFINVSHDVFFLLDFLTPEAGTNRLSRNVGKELSLCAV